MPPKSSPSLTLTQTFFDALRSHPIIGAFGITAPANSKPIIDWCFTNLNSFSKQRKKKMIEINCRPRTIGSCFMFFSDEKWDKGRKKNAKINRETAERFLHAFNINKLKTPSSDELAAFNKELSAIPSYRELLRSSPPLSASAADASSSSLSSGATSSTTSSSSSSSSISALQNKHKHNDDGNFSDDLSTASKRPKYHAATSMTATMARAATADHGSAADHTDDLFSGLTAYHTATSMTATMARAATADHGSAANHTDDPFSGLTAEDVMTASATLSSFHDDLTFWNYADGSLNAGQAAAQAAAVPTAVAQGTTVSQAIVAQAELAAQAVAIPWGSIRDIGAHFTADASSAAATGTPSTVGEETKAEKKPSTCSAASSSLHRISFLSREGVPLVDPPALPLSMIRPK